MNFKTLKTFGALHLALGVALAALTGCEGPPPTATGVSGNGYQVETLFEHEGCTVYRFYDKSVGRSVHYAKCPGSLPATAMTYYSSGKSSQPTEVQTN